VNAGTGSQTKKLQGASKRHTRRFCMSLMRLIAVSQTRLQFTGGQCNGRLSVGASEDVESFTLTLTPTDSTITNVRLAN